MLNSRSISLNIANILDVIEVPCIKKALEGTTSAFSVIQLLFNYVSLDYIKRLNTRTSTTPTAQAIVDVTDQIVNWSFA